MVYRPTEKTRARKQDQRRRLLESARAIVAEGGFAAASIQAVARRADVATGTVYRYFPSKAELFVEVFVHASSREVQQMSNATAAVGDAAAQLRAAIRTWATRALQGRTLAYALIAEPTMPEVEAARLRFRRAYADILRTLIRRGCEQGVFAVSNIDLAAAGMVGALAEALLGPLAPGDAPAPADRPALIDALVDFCLRAIATPPTALDPSS